VPKAIALLVKGLFLNPDKFGVNSNQQQQCLTVQIIGLSGTACSMINELARRSTKPNSEDRAKGLAIGNLSWVFGDDG
jgi:hypothetical protein